MQTVAVLCLLLLASACPAPVLIDASQPAGDCSFPSLSAALAAVRQDAVFYMRCGADGNYALAAERVQWAITLTGEDCTVTLQDGCEVAASAHLTIVGLAIKSTAPIIVYGLMTLDGVRVTAVAQDFAAVFGAVEVLRSHVDAPSGQFLVSSSFGIGITIVDSLFENIACVISLEAVPGAKTPDFAASINVTNVQFYAIQRAAIQVEVSRALFSGSFAASSYLTIDQSDFTGLGDAAVVADVSFWTVAITRSRFSRGPTALRLRLQDLPATIASCEFADVAQAVVVEVLGGSLTLEDCRFERTVQSVTVAQGTATSLLLVSNCYFDHCGGLSAVGAVAAVSNIGTFRFNASQVANCTAAAAAGFKVYSVEHFLVTDSLLQGLSAQDAAVMQVDGSNVEVRRSTLADVTSAGTVNSVLGHSTTVYDRVFASDLSSGSFLLKSYESATNFTYCYFRNCRAPSLMNLIVVYDTVYMFHCVFSNISFDKEFTSLYTSQIFYYENVTFDVSTATESGTLLMNYATQVTFINCRFSGRLMSLVGGVGPLAYTLIRQATFSNLILRAVFSCGTAKLEVYNSSFADVQVTTASALSMATSTLLLQNVSVERFVGPFVVCRQSTLTAQRLEVKEYTGVERSALIDGLQSTVGITASRFEGVRMPSGASLLNLVQTVLTLSATVFSSLVHSDSTGFIVLRQSTASVSSVSVQSYNSSFLSSVESTVSLASSVFAYCGTEQQQWTYDGCAVMGVQMLETKVVNCTFSSLSARSGGAVYLKYTNPTKSNLATTLGFLQASDSKFQNCTAAVDAAGIHVADGSATLLRLQFSGNAAGRHGGALALYCAPADLGYHCFYNVSASTFLDNSAALDGGAIKYDKVAPAIVSEEERGNTAKYGEFTAAYPVKLMLMSKGVLLGESGRALPEAIKVGLFDQHNQLVKSDALSKASIRVLNSSALISGLQMLLPEDGVYSFTSLTLTDTPGSTLYLQVTSEAIDYENADPNSGIVSQPLVFTYQLRTCVPGEVTVARRCEACAAGTYSFNPADPVCQRCPEGLVCSGGAVTIVKPDFWRPNNLSETLVQCRAPDICAGGNEVRCAEGYGGKLCTICDSGFFRYGNFFCAKCGNQLLGIFRGVGILLGAALFFGIMIYGNLKSTAKKKSALSIHLRIFINYNQVAMIMNALQVKWPVSIVNFFDGLKFTGNAAQFAFSSECLMDASVNYIFQKVVLVSVAPLGLVLLCLFFWAPVALCQRSRNYLQVHFLCSVVVLLISMQSVVLHVSLALFS